MPGDLNWDDFTSFLRLKYLRTNKVNSVILGGSDGSEAYTYIMMVLKTLGAEAKKLLPVKSVEMNYKQHSIGVSGKIPLLTDARAAFKECVSIAQNLGDRQGEYFNIIDKHMVMSPGVKQYAQFENADLTDVLNEIPLKNTVLIMRNTWNYLNDFQKYKVAQYLSKMDKSSVFVTGEFDYQWDNSLKRLLKDLHFEYTPVDHVFEKRI